MAVWHRAAEWDCADCAEEPTLKEWRGCAGQQPGEQPFRFGSEDRSVDLGGCPTAYLADSPEVWDLLRAGSLADWKLSLTEQDRLPGRYLDAWAMASREIVDSSREAAKDKHG